MFLKLQLHRQARVLWHSALRESQAVKKKNLQRLSAHSEKTNTEKELAKQWESDLHCD